LIAVISSADNIIWNASTEIEKKINEIANILRTRKGEIPFMRDVGISDDFIDKPITVIKPALTNEITAAINDVVENVTLKSVDFVQGENIGDYIIKVVCEI
jgi:phage baseplate assembly protein W